jgi:hypothetical protein
MRRPFRWLAAGVAALVIAVLVIFRDVLLDEVLPRDELGDNVRQHQGKSALGIVRVEKTQLEDEYKTFSRPDEYHLSPEDEEIIQDIFDSRSGPIIERAQAGSLSPGRSTWKIYLRGQRNQGLRILDMQVVDVVREPPLAGTLFSIPPQGSEDSEVMGVNLDEFEPIVRAARVADSVQFGGPYFPEKSISLADDEEMVIVLRGVTKKNTVSFKLRVDYQVGDRRESAEISDNGKPFRLTAYNCDDDGALDYRSYYSLSGGSEGTTYGVYPIPPVGSDSWC